MEFKFIRLRTIKEAYLELKNNDPNSSLTEYAIRQLVITGKLAHIRRGRKILIDYDELISYLYSAKSIIL